MGGEGERCVGASSGEARSNVDVLSSCEGTIWQTHNQFTIIL